jgi:hypothetical protein
LRRRRPRWRRRHHGEGQGVVEPRKVPLLLLGADEDGHDELLLLGELGWDVEQLTALGRTEDVVRDVANHVIGVVAGHPAVVDVAGDLTGDTWRRWRRLLDLETNASLVFVFVILLFIVIFVVVIIVVVVRGRLRSLLLILIGIAKVAGVPLGVPDKGLPDLLSEPM